MKQLVAFVEGDTLRYFMSEGDKVTQVAQVVNPGFNVRDVVQLGNMLAEALWLNGDRPATDSATETAAERKRRLNRENYHRNKTKPQSAAPARRGRPPGGGLSPRVTFEQMLEYIREHPGVRPSELGAALMPDEDSKVRNRTIGNRLRAMTVRSERAGVPPPVRAEREDYATRLYAT